MKYSFLFALLLMPLAVHAKEKVSLEWKFVSSQKQIPLASGSGHAVETSNNPVVNESTNRVIGIGGILTKEQFREFVKKANSISATVRSLPPSFANSNEKSECKNLKSVSFPQLVGDTRRFSIRKFTPSPKTDSEIGYLLECTPVVQPDGETIELGLHIMFRTLQGFTETILSGDLATTLTQNQSDLSSKQYPRVAEPIFSSRAITTSVTLWSGQTLVLENQSENSSSDYILLTAKIEK